MNDINKSEKEEKNVIKTFCEHCEEEIEEEVDEHTPICKECSVEFVRCISCDELVHWEDAYYIKIYVTPTYFCEPCFAERRFSAQS